MKRNTLLTITALLLQIACLRAETDWTQYGGPNRSQSVEGSIADGKWPDGKMPTLEWSTVTGHTMSPPVIQGNRVYVVASVKPDADVSNGVQPNEIYKRSDAKQIDETHPYYKEFTELGKVMNFLPAGQSLFLVCRTYVFCYDAADGKFLWAQKLVDYEVMGTASGSPTTHRGTPLIHDNKLYCQTMSGYLACLDLSKNGAILWRKDIRELPGEAKSSSSWAFAKAGIAGSPIFYKNTVIFTYNKDPRTNGGSVIITAFNPLTGDMVWTSTVSAVMRNHPLSASVATIDGKDTIVIPTGRSLHGVDATNGTKLWSFDVEAAFPETSKGWNETNSPGTDVYWADKHPARAPIIYGDYVVSRIFIQGGSKYDRTYCVKVTNGSPKLQWSIPARPWRGGMAQKGPYLFLADYGHCTSVSVPADNSVKLRPVNDEGKIQCIDIPTGKRLWDTEAFGKSTDHLALNYMVAEHELLVIGNQLIVIGEKNIGYLDWDASGIKIRANLSHKKSIWGISPLAFAGSKLYFVQYFPTNLGSSESNLFCYDLGGKAP